MDKNAAMRIGHEDRNMQDINNSVKKVENVLYLDNKISSNGKIQGTNYTENPDTQEILSDYNKYCLQLGNVTKYFCCIKHITCLFKHMKENEERGVSRLQAVKKKFV
jgi:hypothetical protein